MKICFVFLIGIMSISGCAHLKRDCRDINYSIALKVDNYLKDNKSKFFYHNYRYDEAHDVLWSRYDEMRYGIKEYILNFNFR